MDVPLTCCLCSAKFGDLFCHHFFVAFVNSRGHKLHTEYIREKPPGIVPDRCTQGYGLTVWGSGRPQCHSGGASAQTRRSAKVLCGAHRFTIPIRRVLLEILVEMFLNFIPDVHSGCKARSHAAVAHLHGVAGRITVHFYDLGQTSI